MWWLYAILWALSPAILYGIALVVTAIVMRYYRRPCPACGQRGLKFVEQCLATVMVNGQRAPDSWSYYICEKCDAVFKLHRGVWSPVPEEEVELFGIRSSPLAPSGRPRD
jgi:hypothetical protein